MGLRVALVSRIITFLYNRLIKNNSKMLRSASASSKGKIFGSAVRDPYAQQLPANPYNTIVQPTPTPVAAHRVLSYRSRSKSKTKSSSTRRRRPQKSEHSALSVDGMYDADDDMSDTPMENIEPIQYTKTGYTQGHGIKRRDTPYPHSLPCSVLPNINQASCGINYLRLMANPSSFDLALPHPMDFTAYDEISCQQIECLDRSPIKFLDLADIGAPRTLAQVQALLSPRVCNDSDGNIVDRFVTDCTKTSGRVYDRLFRRELARISPYAGNSFHRPSGFVFDVCTGAIRKRCMFDDLRDNSAREEGPLDVIDDECDLDYY
jgi:hypothetical protein